MTECQKSPTRAHSPDPSDSGSSPETTQALLHELRVHQLELELQNEELRRVQLELEASRARYFDLYDLAPVGYLTLTDTGVIQEANFRAAELLGEARNALVGQPLTQFILADDQDVYYMHRQQERKDGKEQACELRLRENPNTARWVSLNTTIAEASDGVRGCRVVIQDIGDRKRTETTLRESELRHRVLFEQSPDPLLTLEPPDWNISAVNAASVALFGVDGSDGLVTHALLERSPKLQPGGEPSSVKAKAMTDVALRDGCHSYSWTYCRPSGETFPASVLLTRLEVGGHPLLQARIRDETGAKAAQIRLAQADRLASMRMLAATVAHEINNPLAYVLYNVQSLTEELPRVESAVAHVRTALRTRFGDEVNTTVFGDETGPLTPRAMHDLTERAIDALGGTERIRAISKAIGTFSRVERSESGPVDLNYAVECALTIARTDIKLRAKLDVELGKIPLVRASVGKLSQVILNLLINATHAFEMSKTGHNRLTVRTWRDGNDVLVEVQDTGKGMSAEQLSRIFEPFYTTKEVGMGSGLGLSICRNILAEFDGDIRAESEPGVGSRFIIRLPADIGAARPHVKATAEQARPTSRGRLLVVDDEPAIRKLMVRLLGQEHDLVIVDSGQAAQSLLKHDFDFDLILCDLMMPGMTGMDLRDWLLDENAELGARLVFMTGGAFTPKATNYLDTEDVLTLEKPYEPAKLRELVADRVLAARSKN